MPRNSLERLWLVGGVLLALVLTVFAFLLFIGPQRSATAQEREQVAAVQQQNDILQARIISLTAQNKKLATYQDDLKRAQLALPSTSGIPDFLRTLQSIGASTSTGLSALTVGVPSPLAPTTPAAPPATSGSRATGTANAAQANAVVYSLPITAQVTGSTAALNEFLTQLQSVQPRAVLISSIAESSVNTTGTTSTGNNASTLQLTMQAFVSPGAVEGAALAKAAGK